MKKIIRGAIQIKTDTKQEIEKSVQKLFLEILKQNNLEMKDIDFTLLSQTKDIKSYNAATVLRMLQKTDNDKFALFCCQEADIEGSMPKVIRMLVSTSISTENRAEIKHIYLEGAAQLRPDLSIK